MFTQCNSYSLNLFDRAANTLSITKKDTAQGRFDDGVYFKFGASQPQHLTV